VCVFQWCPPNEPVIPVVLRTSDTLNISLGDFQRGSRLLHTLALLSV
jgi:hypothetical protein